MDRYMLDDDRLNKAMMSAIAGEQQEVNKEDEPFPSTGVYQCYLKERKKDPVTWTGLWRIYDHDDYYAELDVQAGGYRYWLIVGRYANGHYLCIPEWNVGCPLSHNLQDRFWNYGSLSKTMKPFHAMGVVRALEDFSLATGWGSL